MEKLMQGEDQLSLHFLAQIWWELKGANPFPQDPGPQSQLYNDIN